MVLAIELRDLTRAFSPNTGVFGLNLKVERGRIFSFVGPNGSGKTTTIRLLLDYLHPNAGSAILLGLDSRRNAIEIRRHIGYLPGEFRLYEGETGWGLLRYLASFRPKGCFERACQLAERLNAKLDGHIRRYSKGMKQKVMVIQALMHDPELLILDEPTEGFDPRMQQEFHQMLLEARNRGRTIFLSSHVLSEVEQICDEVGIIREGKLRGIERMAELQARYPRILNLNLSEDLPDEAIALPDARLRDRSGRHLSYAFSGRTSELLQALSSVPIADFTLEPPRLEDIFLEYYA